MIVNNHAVLILTVKGELRMGLIDLFQKTRETSMEMKPQEDEAAKVVTCKGCGAELKAYAYGKNLYVCPHCGRYGRLLARTRIRQIADKDSFEERTQIWHRRTRSTSRDTQRKRQCWLKRSACRTQSRPACVRSAVWRPRSALWTAIS